MGEIRHNVMMSVWRLTDNKQLSIGAAAPPDRKRERTTDASKPGWLDPRRSNDEGVGWLSKHATYEVHCRLARLREHWMQLHIHRKRFALNFMSAQIVHLPVASLDELA